MAINKDKVAEAAMDFMDLLDRRFGDEAQVKDVAVVGIVEDEEGVLSAPWSNPPAGGPITAQALRAAASDMEASHYQNGGR